MTIFSLSSLHLPPRVPSNTRQDDSAAPDTLRLSDTHLVAVSAVLAWLGVQLVFFLLSKRHKLENHSMCGITTGGQVGTTCNVSTAFVSKCSLFSGRMLF